MRQTSGKTDFLTEILAERIVNLHTVIRNNIEKFHVLFPPKVTFYKTTVQGTTRLLTIIQYTDFIQNFTVLLTHICMYACVCTQVYAIVSTYCTQFIIFYGCTVNFKEGNGTPLQCPCLENPMDRGAWWAAAHGGLKSVGRN